jgi:hypothetical protein
MSERIDLSVLTLALIPALCVSACLSGCTQEAQNRFSRKLQNWTGTNGVLEVYAGERLVRRFLKIDKLSTAEATEGHDDRPYRYGYGVLDANLNGAPDPDESVVYFEFSDFSTSYIFYEAPQVKGAKKGAQKAAPDAPSNTLRSP